jgi:hypothetical protein
MSSGGGGKADYSLPSSAEVKNERSYTFTPPVRLHGVALNEGDIPLRVAVFSISTAMTLSLP